MGNERIKCGGDYYQLSRMSDATETVHVVEDAGGGRYIVRTRRGTELVVDAAELSLVLPDDYYRAIRARASLRVPVRDVVLR